MNRYCIALVLALIGPGIQALANPPEDVVVLTVLPGWQDNDGERVIGLHLNLKSGWKTYWRAPGDAGIPPSFDWRGSRNLAGVAVEWPTPEVIDQGGVMTLGYAGEVTFPLRLTPSQGGKPIRLKGKIELGVCKDVCIPVTLSLSETLPVEGGERDPRIVAALADRPHSAREGGVTRVACRIMPIKDGVGLSAEIDLPRTGAREMAIFEVADPKVWVAQGRTVRAGGRLTADASLYHENGQAFAVNRSGIRITVLGGGYAVDIQGCPAG